MALLWCYGDTMKRPFKPTVDYRAAFGIVSLDFTKDQFAGIGHVAMAYNMVEERIYHLFGITTELSGQMLAEVFTRIGGIDGIAAIIVYGAQRAGLSEREMEALRETLGDGGFGKYKKCRDATIHAWAFNAPAGIGVRLERRARVQEILMTPTALETLAAHLSILSHEIENFEDIVVDRRQLLNLSSDDPERAQSEEYFQECFSRFQDCRNRRIALPPLPDFPTEAELISAREAWRETLPFRAPSKVEPRRG
jgi:hypothetical protein